MPRVSPDQLCRDPYPTTRFAHAAFEDVAHAQLHADLLDVDSLSFVGEGRMAGDHWKGSPAGEHRDNVLGDAVGKIFLLRIAAEVDKRQDRDGAPVVEPRRARDGCAGATDLGLLSGHLINANRSCDVFEVLRTQVDEVEISLAGDLIVDILGNVDAAWLGERLEPRRDIDAIAED